MSPVRTFLLLATVIGTAGCYDLSAPGGPGPDDFAKNSAGTPTADPADDTCTGDDCPAESALTTHATRPADDRRNDVVLPDDATHQALQARQK